MIEVHPDPESLARAAAELFAAEAALAAGARGRFTAALSGGTTPRRTYEVLAETPFRERVPWTRVHAFFGDERCVPRDDPRSNARMARLALLDAVPIPPRNVHPIPAWQDPERAAEEYEAALRAFLGDGPPRFDLVLLGLGENGHTASLFPGSPLLEERVRWAVPTAVPEQGVHRVTLTLQVLNQARAVVFLVAGASKAGALREVIEGPFDPQRLPAQLIRPESGDLRWLVDEAAAGGLSAAGRAQG